MPIQWTKDRNQSWLLAICRLVSPHVITPNTRRYGSGFSVHFENRLARIFPRWRCDVREIQKSLPSCSRNFNLEYSRILSAVPTCLPRLHTLAHPWIHSTPFSFPAPTLWTRIVCQLRMPTLPFPLATEATSLSLGASLHSIGESLGLYSFSYDKLSVPPAVNLLRG
ncbi:uncharacterized protein EI90DRAFT_2690740 [Cantharellus anzutake]|uniref:uncharacterized protein n=1 Tax=Cantharellus anzutake TaxID=1750568 RepID=UPI00190552BC|nr:uncharacterized protein EI90DRAFT_2690740 [Cantharellus anzutake]KAF8318925.1 hypothetical protein EI90DRAFT_2690740 [Cantharellus anzutake]